MQHLPKISESLEARLNGNSRKKFRVLVFSQYCHYNGKEIKAGLEYYVFTKCGDNGLEKVKVVLDSLEVIYEDGFRGWGYVEVPEIGKRKLKKLVDEDSVGMIVSNEDKIWCT